MVTICAEIGQCAEGDLEIANQAIRGFAMSCDIVKFQTLTPELIASKDAKKYWTDDFGTADQREAFAAAGMFRPEDWGTLADMCHDAGVLFQTTPFDLPAVELLAPHVDLWKIASGDITNRRLIEAVAETGFPVALSTGASTLQEIDDALEWLSPAGQVTILACSLEYPTPPERAHLARIQHLRYFGYDYEYGYSDHTTGTLTALAAAAMGADYLEKHSTWVLGPGQGGKVADHSMALNPFQMIEYRQHADHGLALRGLGNFGTHEGEIAARHGARRSLYLSRAIEAGDTIGLDDLIELRPGGGIGPEQVYDVAGSVAVRDLARGQRLGWDDLSTVG